jgi:hypothetical protein
MPEQRHDRPLALTIHVPPAVAKRLEQAAVLQGRSAAELAVELLDRHLPRLPGGTTQQAKKGNIPYA